VAYFYNLNNRTFIVISVCKLQSIIGLQSSIDLKANPAPLKVNLRKTESEK